MTGIQLPIEVRGELPLDPRQLVELSSPERGVLYGELGLDRLQIAAAEEATRAVLRGEYGKRRRR
jgi:hypothetical protein